MGLKAMARELNPSMATAALNDPALPNIPAISKRKNERNTAGVNGAGENHTQITDNKTKITFRIE